MKFFGKLINAIWQVVVIVWQDGLWPLLQWGWKNKVKFAIVSFALLLTLGVLLQKCGQVLDVGRVMEERAKNAEFQNLRKERDELRSKVVTSVATPAPVSKPSTLLTLVTVEKKGKPEDIDGIGLKPKTPTPSQKPQIQIPVGANIIRSVPKTDAPRVSESEVVVRVPDRNCHWFKESGTFLDVRTGERFVAPPEILCRDNRAQMVFRPFATFARINPVLAEKILRSCPKRSDRVLP